MSKSRSHICFTAFTNAFDDIPENAEVWTKLPEGVNYLVYQWEKCPSTGEPHIQGYAEFPNKITYNNAVKRLGCSKAWKSARKGTAQQAAEYCKKPERWGAETGETGYGPWELGEMSKGQGDRSDLRDVFNMCKEGKSLLEIAEKHPSDAIRYSTGISKIMATTQQNTFEEKKITVFVGKTSTGKSTRCWENAGILAYAKNTSKWWCGYYNQEDVVISDYNGQWSLIDLLNMFDKWPCRVETKGSTVMLKCKRIWIGTNTDPKLWYPKAKSDEIDALMRRLTIVNV